MLRHAHDIDDKAGPAQEVCRALALARHRVILFPGVASRLPFPEDVVYNGLAELSVDPRRLLLVRPFDLAVFLLAVVRIATRMVRRVDALGDVGWRGN